MGEDLAAQWYVANGYAVVDRNWVWRRDGAGTRISGEVDLVAVGRGTVAFCEVKARAGDGFGGPLAAVTRQKQERLRRLAVAWLAERRPGAFAVRFDVAAVVGDRLEMVLGAF
ncbi:MAG: YraN family protein [Ilumatobacteraceae bacterium]